MHNAYVTPRDSLSHMPLPIFPQTDEQTNEHHVWHPRSQFVGTQGGSEPTEFSLGLEALQASRIQAVPIVEHRGYHKVCAGPMLPNPRQLFNTLILSAAGYVPREGIVLDRHGGFSIKPLSEKWRTRLWEQGSIDVDNTQTVKRYLFAYAIAHGLDNVSNSIIDEFLGSRNGPRRQKLGAELVRLASDAATDSAQPDYAVAWETGLLPPNRPSHIASYVGGLLVPSTHHMKGKTLEQIEHLVTAALAA
jgi:hypothetical protein